MTTPSFFVKTVTDLIPMVQTGEEYAFCNLPEFKNNKLTVASFRQRISQDIHNEISVKEMDVKKSEMPEDDTQSKCNECYLRERSQIACWSPTLNM